MLPAMGGILGRAAVLLGSRGRLYSAAAGSGGAAATEPSLGPIPLAFPALCVWGSNTGVGKTLFSAGLAAAARRAGVSRREGVPAATVHASGAGGLLPCPPGCCPAA